MTLLYDHQIFYAQKFGGISRYFTEIINKLEKNKGVEIYMPQVMSDNAYIHSTKIQQNQKAPLLTQLKNGVAKTIYSEKKFNTFIKKVSQKETIELLKAQKFDVFHPTYYNPYFLEHLGKKPFVITIHDMIHERFPEYFPQTDKVIHNKKVLAKKADKIIAISENTKQDIMELLDINENKIEVIYHGNSFESAQLPQKPSITMPERYLLFVGSRGIYKNFLFFLTSVAGILKQENIHLLTIGGGKFDSHEHTVIDQLAISDQIHQFDATDSELEYLYRHAVAFCFPSLYEGFGLPILEAFSHNVPVLLSNSSCFPEIAGDAGIYFDPNTASSIQDAIMTVLEDGVRDTLLEKGHQRLNLFTWENSSQRHLQLYKALA